MLLTTKQQGEFHFTKANHVSVLKSLKGIGKNTWTLSDVKPPGTNGGTFLNGAWRTRVLNTIMAGPGASSDVTLAGNQITLMPGSYYISARASALLVNRHKARFRNITDGVTEFHGTSEFSLPGGFGISATSDSLIEGIVTVPKGGPSKVFELQHRCQTSQATFGFGLASGFGISEVYAIVSIIKMD